MHHLTSRGGRKGVGRYPRSKMEPGEDDGVFLSSDVDLDVSLKVRAAQSSPCSRNSQLKKDFSRSRALPLLTSNFAGY